MREYEKKENKKKSIKKLHYNELLVKICRAKCTCFFIMRKIVNKNFVENYVSQCNENSIIRKNEKTMNSRSETFVYSKFQLN